MEKNFKQSILVAWEVKKKVGKRTLTKLKLRFTYTSRLFLWPAVYEQSIWLFMVTSVSDVLIKNNPLFWYSHNIPPMTEMSNVNITKRGT